MMKQQQHQQQKRQRALVTGANGFTGSHLVKALTLTEQYDQVVALVRSPSSDISRLQQIKCTTIRYADVANMEELETAMKEVDIVFHIAAYVELGIVNKDRMWRANVEGTKNILALAKQSTTTQKIVYCSTVGIYGDTKGNIVNEQYQRQQTNFSGFYDETKLLAQKAIDEASSDLHIVSIMPSGIFGVDDPHFGPYLYKFIDGRLNVIVGGKRIMNIVHVDDLVDLMIRAANLARPGQHFIASAGEISLQDLFRTLGRLVHRRPPWELPEYLVRLVAFLLDPIGRIFCWNPPISHERVHYVYERNVRVSGSKARQVLGWKPRSPEEILTDFVKSKTC